MKRRGVWCVLLFSLCIWAAPARTQALLDILQEELKRNFSALQERGEPKPYYLSYEVTDREVTVIDASYGSLRSSATDRQRILDVSIRVGTPQLDNYHRVQRGIGKFTSGSMLALENNRDAIVRTMWRDTDRAYRAAAERLGLILSNKEQRVEARDPSPDFSAADPVVDELTEATVSVDSAAWEPKLKRWSAMFRGHESILTSNIALRVTAETRYFVDSEGGRIRHGRTFARLEAAAQSKASDGMNLGLLRSAEGEKPDELPSDREVQQMVEGLIRDLEQLKLAPEEEPYVGPAILSGRATAVFFHEIFGHRMEGHRQKDDAEGQTFTNQVGQQVLPSFLDVIADPSQKRINGQDLMGWYAYDDEGVAGQKTSLVEKGTLKNFHMSRSPIQGFDKSNGHGRRAPGNEVVSRQSNLIVKTSQTVSETKLREMLVAEVRRQGKPYGLYFADVTGGLTNTGRNGMQAFTVIPLMVYRVYADGRPDELVRGVDIVGTPLTSFSKIVAAADTVEVFNGYCGAESGSIPVSAVAPAILTSEIETQKRAKANDRPPLLSFPTESGGNE